MATASVDSAHEFTVAVREARKLAARSVRYGIRVPSNELPAMTEGTRPRGDGPPGLG